MTTTFELRTCGRVSQQRLRHVDHDSLITGFQPSSVGEVRQMQMKQLMLLTAQSTVQSLPASLASDRAPQSLHSHIWWANKQKPLSMISGRRAPLRASFDTARASRRRIAQSRALAEGMKFTVALLVRRTTKKCPRDCQWLKVGILIHGVLMITQGHCTQGHAHSRPALISIEQRSF